MSPVHHSPDVDETQPLALAAMDLKPLRRQPLPPPRNSPRSLSVAGSPRLGGNPWAESGPVNGFLQLASKAERCFGASATIRNLLAFAAGSTIVLVLIVLFGANWSNPFDLLRSRARIREGGELCSLDQQSHSNGGLFEPYAEPVKDKLLGGLLAATFDESSCLSRYQLASYWKELSHKPSAYLVERLRKYEDLHKKCGPDTELYRKAVEQLKSNSSSGTSECNYVVWLPVDGLGNRILSMVSTFLYALLNNKVLLLKLTGDLQDLFCEPFPNSSWVLPSDFPLQIYDLVYNPESPRSYGNMLRQNVLSNDMKTMNVTLPAYAYLYLRHDYGDWDKMFYCEEAQLLLQRFPWLLVSSNQYFVPALFLITQYHEELNQLFPEKESVFHHLGRYLLHPADFVWGYITRYYESYLSNADEKVGLQIRNIFHGPLPFEDMLAQIINCSLNEKLLPGISIEANLRQMSGGARKAVLVTNLNNSFFQKLRNMYYEHPTITGEVISVYQPSNEERQQTEKKDHNAKALSEMYLLSFTDFLVTSEWSTFGYVAQALGGLRPWILHKPDQHGPPCRRAMSMEPCFHFPQSYECKSKSKIDKGSVLPYLRHCEDTGQGLKLFSQPRL